MYTNTHFKQRVDNGEALWDACGALTEEQNDVMFYRATAVLCYFKRDAERMLAEIDRYF